MRHSRCSGYAAGAHVARGKRLLAVFVRIRSLCLRDLEPLVAEEHWLVREFLREHTAGVLAADDAYAEAAEQVALELGGSRETYVGWMNQRMADLELRDTRFVNPSGMDATGHYSTAYDMAMLGREPMHNL